MRTKEINITKIIGMNLMFCHVFDISETEIPSCLGANMFIILFCYRGVYCTCHRPYPDEEDTVPDAMIQVLQINSDISYQKLTC